MTETVRRAVHLCEAQAKPKLCSSLRVKCISESSHKNDLCGFVAICLIKI